MSSVLKQGFKKKLHRLQKEVEPPIKAPGSFGYKYRYIYIYTVRIHNIQCSGGSNYFLTFTPNIWGNNSQHDYGNMFQLGGDFPQTR